MSGKINIMPHFCECENCTTELVFASDNARLERNRYTVFYAFKCKDCSGWRGLPEESFKLAIAEGTEDCKNEMRASGIPIEALAEIIKKEKSGKNITS